MAGAFQVNAFQDNAFQITAVVVSVPVKLDLNITDSAVTALVLSDALAVTLEISMAETSLILDERLAA